MKKETMRPTTQAYKGDNEKVSGRTQSESITVYCDYGHIEAEEGKVGKGNGSRVTKCSSTGILAPLFYEALNISEITYLPNLRVNIEMVQVSAGV
jgi:hypothetical protein